MTGAKKRRRLFVDEVFQGSLVFRAMGYWLSCVLAIVATLLIWGLITRPSNPLEAQMGHLWHSFGPVLIGALLILPLVVHDVLKVTHHFAGPLYRLRRELQRLARGEDANLLAFRHGDFWPEMAEEFNAVLRRLQRAELRAAATLTAGEEQAAASQDMVQAR